jgi:hypothetical protein
VLIVVSVIVGGILKSDLKYEKKGALGMLKFTSEEHFFLMGDVSVSVSETTEALESLTLDVI